MGSNVKSNIWLCSHAIPPMAERGGGSVVIVSSIGGLRGSPVIGAYGISKAADFSLCRSLAGEWGPKGVRVNCVAPGLVKTDFARALWEDEERLKRRCATTPLAPHRRARRDRRRGGVSRLRCVELHDRADHRGRWRRDHGVGVAVPCPGRGARLFSACTRRAGTRSLRQCDQPGPRLAAHRSAKCYALRCVRGTARRIDEPFPIRLPCRKHASGKNAAMSYVLAIDQGTTSSRAIRVPAGHLDRRVRRSRNSRSIFPPPAGSSTSRRTSGPRPSPPAARR